MIRTSLPTLLRSLLPGLRPRQRLIRALCVLLPLLLLGIAAPALADVTVKIRQGHDGRWIRDAATPFFVDLDNSGGQPVEVTLRLRASGGIMGEAGELTLQRSVLVGTGGKRTETFLLPGPADNELQVYIETDPPVTVHVPSENRRADRGRTTIEVRSENMFDNRAIEYSERVVGVVGARQNTLAAKLPDASRASFTMVGMEGEAQDYDKVVAITVSPATLRLAPLSLDGIDSLILVDPDATLAPTDAETDLLMDWVAGGGTLVICAGNAAAEFATTPLAAELPATWTGVGQADYHGIATKLLGLKASEVGGTNGVWVTLVPREGLSGMRVGTLDPADRPFFVQRRVGLGRVIQLAFDASVLATSLNKYEQVAPLASLIAPIAVEQLKDEKLTYSSIQLGDQLAYVLRKDAVKPPPLPLVLLALFMYVAVVGPLDWLVLKRLGRQRLTTFTFTAAVIGFTVLAYGASVLIFASGELVNRVVFLDLVDTGRGGRHVHRATDIAGYYSPRGADQTLSFAQPAVLLSRDFPTSQKVGNTGRKLDVIVHGDDALQPRAELRIAFRSQRTMRASLAGPMGRSVEIDWQDPQVAPVLTNGLPIDIDHGYIVASDARGNLDSVFLVGGCASGGNVTARRAQPAKLPGRQFLDDQAISAEPNRAEVEGLLCYLGLARFHQLGGSGRVVPAISLSDLTMLAKSGIDRSSVVLGRRRALFVGFASAAPFPLPGDDAAGETYVLIRKEIDLP